jgi:hypothetical protein
MSTCACGAPGFKGFDGMVVVHRPIGEGLCYARFASEPPAPTPAMLRRAMDSIPAPAPPDRCATCHQTQDVHLLGHPDHAKAAAFGFHDYAPVQPPVRTVTAKIERIESRGPRPVSERMSEECEHGIVHDCPSCDAATIAQLRADLASEKERAERLERVLEEDQTRPYYCQRCDKAEADLAREKAEVERLTDRVAQLDDSNRKAAVLLGYGDPPSVEEAVRLDEALAREKERAEDRRLDVLERHKEINDLRAERDALAERVEALEAGDEQRVRDLTCAYEARDRACEAFDKAEARVAKLTAALREIASDTNTSGRLLAKRAAAALEEQNKYLANRVLVETGRNESLAARFARLEAALREIAEGTEPWAERIARRALEEKP